MLRAAQSVRSLSVSAVRQQDLVQQTFIKKIREYAQKGGDLANSDPAVKKALQDELNRLAMKFQLSNTEVVSTLPTNFTSAKVECAVTQLLDGQTLKSLNEQVKKDKAAFVAARDARKAEEAARKQ